MRTNKRIEAPRVRTTHRGSVPVGDRSDPTAARDHGLSEESLQLLVDNFPGVVYLRRDDDTQSLIYLGESVEALTGCEQRAFLDGVVTIAALCHSADRARREAEITRAVAAGDPFHLTYRLHHRTRGWRWIEERGGGVRAAGQIGLVEGSLIDVTDREPSRRGEAVESESTGWDAALSRGDVRRLTFEATHDALTGLVNRVEFDRRLERAVRLTIRPGDPDVLCFLDLDGFKQINDTWGHLAGDAILRQLGHELRRVLRARDTLARLGGDEFGLLLEHCPEVRARGVADSMLRVVQQFRLPWQGQRLSVGVSIGIATTATSRGGAEKVLGDADAACYAAKRRGGNCIEVSAVGGASIGPADVPVTIPPIEPHAAGPSAVGSVPPADLTGWIAGYLVDATLALRRAGSRLAGWRMSRYRRSDPRRVAADKTHAGLISSITLEDRS